MKGFCRRAGGGEGGFTLVETIVSSAVLTLAIGSMIVGFVVGMRTARAAKQRMMALHVARNQVETLKASSYVHSGLSVGTHTFDDGFYTVSNNASYADTKDIAVTVQYVDPGNNTCRVSLCASVTRALHSQ